MEIFSLQCAELRGEKNYVCFKCSNFNSFHSTPWNSFVFYYFNYIMDSWCMTYQYAQSFWSSGSCKDMQSRIKHSDMWYGYTIFAIPVYFWSTWLNESNEFASWEYTAGELRCGRVLVRYTRINFIWSGREAQPSAFFCLLHLKAAVLYVYRKALHISLPLLYSADNLLPFHCHSSLSVCYWQVVCTPLLCLLYTTWRPANAEEDK